jgi:hypothetical protein
MRIFLRVAVLIFPISMTVWLGSVGSTSIAQAQDGRWGFGTDIGLWTGTTNNTVFAVGFNLDYYLDPAFSFGPMLIITPVGDLTQIAMAGVARYHIRLRSFNIVPFAGLGLVHADLDRGTGPGRIDKNDTSHFIPLGIAAEYQLGPKIALSTTLMINLHDLNLDPPVGQDDNSVALMFGMRFGP